MTWQRYEIVFQLLSPLHIGWRKTGNLQQTRGYLPGKNLWAALTARLTRTASNGANATAYQAMGDLLQEHFRFTYFYPALQDGNNFTPHYPWQDDFAYHFLDSYASTALNYPNQSAADGLLHETEFIAPRTRTNQLVYLTGSFYVRPTVPSDLANWQNALHKLQFGGEQGYGWGQVQLAVQPLVGHPITGAPQGEWVKETKGDRVLYRSTAHLITDNITNVTGPVEPLIGWERNHEPSGGTKWRLSSPTICYAPGAKSDLSTGFMIGHYGIWK